ncbi:MAG TPA: dihydrodipicolinate synthase family protein [Planctomycetota bacterium]|nr:dihydrodipicolinate synthase family protein [Planctomycetota bacterium]
MTPDKLARLRKGVVIPAHPLALTSARTLDERRQRALTRYYLAAGAGGIAVGVHTTQFAIREAGLLRPVLEIAADEEKRHKTLTLKIAGICGPTAQAVAEAALARELGYDIGLLSLAALKDATEDALIAHAAAVGGTLPLFGFYLQPAVGGRLLPYSFWRRFVELPSVVGIKMAPFNRYQTLDVLRAVAESGRAGEIALYTGNDDNILLDLLTEFRFGEERLRIVGGLLGHWSVWTRTAVELLAELQHATGPTTELLTRAAQITDANAAFFDAANGFRGCIAGLHEVLRRQGLLEGRWCLDAKEELSPGQKEEIDRVYRAYPRLHDDAFVEKYRDLWLVQ